MIKAIVFDYGGVIELKDGDLIQEIADSLQITKKDWQKVYFSLNHLANTGKESWQEVLALVCKEFGASDAQISDVLGMIVENKKTKKIDLELVELIKDLKNKNYKIGLLSNNATGLRQKLIDQNIIDLFNEVIISAEFGFQKPQLEIFEIIFNKLGIKNNEMVFVDDTERSLEGADKIGYVPILYTNNETLKSELSNILGIKI
jgi:epoxide hydrolase-like predicted phosphatase